MTDFRTHPPGGGLHRDPFPVVRVSPEKLARAFYWLPTDNVPPDGPVWRQLSEEVIGR